MGLTARELEVVVALIRGCLEEPKACEKPKPEVAAMKHQGVDEAFEILLDELETVLTEAREEAARASRAGRYDEAQALLAKAQQIEKFTGEIRAKRKEWEHLSAKPHRTRKPSAKRLRRGERTLGEDYRLPILRALVALGGEAKMQQVLERVCAEMKGRLKPADLQPLPSGTELRWRNTAQWERFKMVNEGLLRRDSPRGIWAITDKGRTYLRQHEG